MRVIAWNIRAGGGRRIERIARALAGWAPDVVLISEFRATPPSSRLAADLAGLGLAHHQASADPAAPARNALLIASRWPLAPVRALAAVGPDACRWLSVRVRAPRAFYLGGFHVPNRVSGRKYDFLEATLSWAETFNRRPAILIGDSNSGMPGVDEQTRAFNGREAQWIRGLDALGWSDAYRRLHGDRRVYSWYSPNGDNGFRLDQAFITTRLLPRVDGVRYRWAGGSRRAGVSDHAAVQVDLGV